MKVGDKTDDEKAGGLPRGPNCLWCWAAGMLGTYWGGAVTMLLIIVAIGGCFK